MESEDSNIVVLRKYNSTHEAEFAKSILESVGIESYIPDMHTANMLSYMAPIFNGICLQVKKEDFEKADEVLTFEQEECFFFQ